jgi:CMP-N,N'-diacetyllegionaminic acid synthase
MLAIIPARGGSEFKDKNIKPLCGIPLIEHTIEAVTKSRLTDWFVFTDKYTQYKTLCINRLTKHSKGAYNSVVEWLPYAISEFERVSNKEVEDICLLQPTSPLRTYTDIDNAVSMYFLSGKDSLVSGYYMRIKTNEVDHKTKPLHFQRNGAIFIFKKSMVETGRLWNNDTVLFEMPKSRSIDIDTEDDFFIAEAIKEKLCGI